MKTGFDFFDRHEPKPGALWVVASHAKGGKSLLLENLTRWFVLRQPPDSRAKALFYNTERPADSLRALFSSPLEKSRIEVRIPRGPFENSNFPVVGWSEELHVADIVTIDQFDLMAGAARRLRNFDEELMGLKRTIVGLGCLALVSISLPYYEHLAERPAEELLSSREASAWSYPASVILVPTCDREGMHVRVLKGIDGIDRCPPGLFDLDPQKRLLTERLT